MIHSCMSECVHSVTDEGTGVLLVAAREHSVDNHLLEDQSTLLVGTLFDVLLHFLYQFVSA